jgi:hypothetical protein
MTKVFLLFYSKDEGSREDWSVFYTPCEAFSSDADRLRRIQKLIGQETYEDSDDVWEDEDFYLTEMEIGNPDSAKSRMYQERNYD